MNPTNLGDMLAHAWEESLLTTEDPFSDPSGIVGSLFGRPRPSYRAYLDRKRINMRGEVIPQIVFVRRHLLWLNDPHLPAARLPR